MLHRKCHPGPQGETEAGGGGSLPGQPGRGLPQPEPGAEQQAAPARPPVRGAPATAFHASGDVGGGLWAPLPGLAQQERRTGAASDALGPGAHARGALQEGTPAVLLEPPGIGRQAAQEQRHRRLVLLQQEHSAAEEPVSEEKSHATRPISFIKAH